MFQFLTQLAERKQAREQQAIDDAGRYAQLVRKGATGKLSSSEVDELDALAIKLNVSVEDMEADAEGAAEHARLQPIADQLDARMKAHADASSAVDRHDVETSKQIIALREKRQAERGKLSAAATAALSPVEESRDAAQRLEAIESARWKIFDRPAPEVVAAEAKAVAEADARTKYILRMTPQNMGNHRKYEGKLVWFESHLREGNPCNIKLDNYDFHLADGQSPEDLAWMLAALREVEKGNYNYAYIVRHADRPKYPLDNTARGLQRLVVLDMNGTIVDADAVLSTSVGDPDINPDAWRFIPLPGQSWSEVESLVSRLKKSWADRHPATGASAAGAALRQQATASVGKW